MQELTAVAAALEGIGLIALLLYMWRKADVERRELQRRLFEELSGRKEPPAPAPVEDLPIIST